MKSKDGIVRIGVSLLLIVAVFILITKVISPAINNAGDDFKNMFIVVLVFVTTYIINALMFAFTLEELRRILTVEGSMFLALILPIKSDIVFRDYYAQFQEEVGDDGLKSIYAILPVIVSLAFVAITCIWLPFVAYREGISYMTRELGLVAVFVLLSFSLLQVVRCIAVCKIIKECGPLTYINNPGKYSVIANVIAVSWLLVFMVSPLLSIIGINITHPIMNVLAVILPITLLPVISYLGIKTTSKDMTLDYDMDIY